MPAAHTTNTPSARPIAVSHFYLDVDHHAAGYLSSFQVPSYEADEVIGGLGPDYHTIKSLGKPSIGEAAAVFNISQSGPLLNWMATIWDKRCKTADTTVFLADQNYNIVRAIDMQECLISAIEFPELKASDGKKPLDVTCKWKPTELDYKKGGGKIRADLGQRAKAWMVANYDVHTAFRLDTKWITSASLPKITAKIAPEHYGALRLPSPMYAAIEFSTIKIEIGRQGYQAAEDLAVKAIKKGNFEKIEEDIIIDMLDQRMNKVLGTFTIMGCTPKKFEWSGKLEGGKDTPSVATIEFLVQDFRFQLKHT